MIKIIINSLVIKTINRIVNKIRTKDKIVKIINKIRIIKFSNNHKTLKLMKTFKVAYLKLFIFKVDKLKIDYFKKTPNLTKTS